jgi:iron(III) transport system permease protein
MRSSLTSRADASARLAPVFLALLVLAAPVVALAVKGAGGFHADLALHLASTILPLQLWHTLLATVGSVVLALLLAGGSGCCALFRFPGQAVLSRLLLLPLLLPTWFLAVVYRERWGVEGTAWLALVLAVGGAPFIHLLLAAGARDLPARYGELLRCCGRSGLLDAGRVLVPLLGAPLAVGAGCVLLLGWSDVAAARTLAVPTLGVGLMDQWSGREEDAVAAWLALLLAGASLLPVAVLVALLARVGAADSGRLPPGSGAFPLSGWARAVPWVISAPQLVLGVVLPLAVTGGWAGERLGRVDLGLLEGDVVRSVLVALGSTLLAASLALPFLHLQATSGSPRWAGAAGRLTLVHLALPALVVGLAFLWLLPAGSDVGVAAAVNATPVPLLLALGCRHAGVFVGTGQAALARHGRDHAQLVRVLGLTGLPAFLRLFHPFLWRPLTAAAAITFLEALKDLPVSLVLQPFGFTTIPLRVFQYAQAQRVKECAVWVVCLALVGLYPLFTLARLGDNPPRAAA